MRRARRELTPGGLPRDTANQAAGVAGAGSSDRGTGAVTGEATKDTACVTRPSRTARIAVFDKSAAQSSCAVRATGAATASAPTPAVEDGLAESDAALPTADAESS